MTEKTYRPLSIRKSTHSQLMHLKQTLGARSVDEVINLLMRHGERGAISERRKELERGLKRK